MLSRRMRHHSDILSKFLTQRIMRYRRSPQVWVREWNLWALREHLCQQTFFRIANFRLVKEMRCFFGTTLST